jgi:GNAT superfamily N-acetyltransferase
MHSDVIGEYVSAFGRRSALMLQPHERKLAHDGIVGTVAASPEQMGGRLLITDDRALEVVRGLLPELPAQVVCVLEPAAKCRELLRTFPALGSEAATAMVCPDLAAVPAVDGPTELDVRRVRRLPDDDPDGVPVEQAAAACLRAEPEVIDSLEVFAAYLRSLPPAAHLFAAVDKDGEVRATAASGCFGADANAFFVSTDHAWRGRGVATAMTAFVLREAHQRGAVRACLEASAAGRSIYQRLGFVAACPLTMFMRIG